MRALILCLLFGCATVQTTSKRVGGLNVSDGGAGSGPAVVLHHGLGSNMDVWRAQVEHLRKSHRVIVFDARGHGASEKAASYSIDALADDVDAVVSMLGVQKFWLVGHSMAGAVLSAYAGKHPEKLAGLIYVDAVGDLSQAPQELKDFFLQQQPKTPDEMKAAFAEMLGDKAKPATRAAVLDSAAHTDPLAFAQLRADLATHSYLAGAMNYPGPKLAIEQGEASPYIASSALHLERSEIGGVSHWLMLDAPDRTNALLDEVLNEPR